MHTGILWLSPTVDMPLSKMLEKAGAHFRRRYHRAPNLCLVHAGMLGSDSSPLAGFTVRTCRQVQPGHVWIGIEDRT